MWNWYRSVFSTRIWEGGAIIIIMTRWHDDDLAGRLLKSQADRWDVFRFPAIAESQETRDINDKYLGLSTGQPDLLDRDEGEPLSPSRFSRNALLEIKTDVGTQAWGAEYDGVPRPLDGTMFKRHWFGVVEQVPIQAHRIRYWDKAGTEGGGSYSVGALVAIDSDGIAYVEDIVRGQWSSGEREKIIKNTADQDRALYGYGIQIYVEQEPGSGGKESAQNTIKNLKGHTVYADRVTGSKDVRLQPFSAYSEAGNVKLKRATWNEVWLDEITAIPNSTNRDQSDATGGAFNKLTAGQPVEAEPADELESFWYED